MHKLPQWSDSSRDTSCVFPILPLPRTMLGQQRAERIEQGTRNTGNGSRMTDFSIFRPISISIKHPRRWCFSRPCRCQRTSTGMEVWELVERGWLSPRSCLVARARPSGWNETAATASSRAPTWCQSCGQREATASDGPSSSSLPQRAAGTAAERTLSFGQKRVGATRPLRLIMGGASKKRGYRN